MDMTWMAQSAWHYHQELLPTFWTPIAEKLNGRAAMVGRCKLDPGLKAPGFKD